MAHPIYLSINNKPPISKADRWPGMKVTWTGWNGRRWDLSNYQSGVFLTAGDVEGLAMPKGSQRSSASPAIHGTRPKPTRIEERSIFWPIYVYSPGKNEDFQDIDAEFWETMVYDKPGVWEISIPGQPNSRRQLVCSFVDDGRHTFDRDPTKTGWQAYGIEMVAHQPFWEGDWIDEWFGEGAYLPFFGPNGNDATPFNISEKDTITTSILSNPGQMPAWPVWYVIGPTSNASVGIGNRIIELPFPIDAGKAVEIDTDPLTQSVLLGTWNNTTKALTGTLTDVYPLLGKDQFAEIPAGLRRTLAVVIEGTGSSGVKIRPKYYRAWGRH